MTYSIDPLVSDPKSSYLVQVPVIESILENFSRRKKNDMKRLFVGNLPFNTTDEDLHELFASFGEVASARVIVDRETQRSRGFGFVEMESGLAATAIADLNDTDYGGRNIRVSEANEREQRGNSFGGRR